MGNCQAAEAATVVIQHPGGKVERAYWSLSVSHVMASNPGHYVAAVIPATAPHHNGVSHPDAPVKHLKLLRPDDTLHIGRVYRLVRFEEVLREFNSKKPAKLGRLLIELKQNSSLDSVASEGSGDAASSAASSSECQPWLGGGAVEAELETSPATEQQVAESVETDGATGGSVSVRQKAPRRGHWRPTLQSIAEIGSST